MSKDVGHTHGNEQQGNMATHSLVVSSTGIESTIVPHIIHSIS